MARVLLIDDDASLLDVLALSFEDAGHAVRTAPDGLAGWRALQHERPDVVVSDVNMPGLDGFSLARRMRESDDATPLVLLTSRDGEIDEALGLDLGADDYVVKPFSTRVLLARVAALLRRQDARERPGDQGVRSVGALQVHAERLELTWRGHLLTTTVTEFRLIETLTARPGIVLSREQLLRATRDDDSVVVDRIIDTYVRRMRRKFEEIDPDFDRIDTVIGAGYRWRD
jgi:DNA-binding response OmpR family regulator